MKVCSSKRLLLPFEISRERDSCQIRLYGNLQPQRQWYDPLTGALWLIWEYDYYELTEPFRANLQADLRDNHDAWLARAAEAERAAWAEEVRARRDALLDKADLVYCNAANWELLSAAERAAWQDYKQALRDLPEQAGFPAQVDWPLLPQRQK